MLFIPLMKKNIIKKIISYYKLYIIEELKNKKAKLAYNWII